MNFIEIHQLADKKKWATRFMKQYKGEINPNAYAYQAHLLAKGLYGSVIWNNTCGFCVKHYYSA